MLHSLAKRSPYPLLFSSIIRPFFHSVDYYSTFPFSLNFPIPRYSLFGPCHLSLLLFVLYALIVYPASLISRSLFQSQQTLNSSPTGIRHSLSLSLSLVGSFYLLLYFGSLCIFLTYRCPSCIATAQSFSRRHTTCHTANYVHSCTEVCVKSCHQRPSFFACIVFVRPGSFLNKA